MNRGKRNGKLFFWNIKKWYLKGIVYSMRKKLILQRKNRQKV